MTQLFPVVLKKGQTFTFQPVLDSVTYNGLVTWQIFGRRPYLNLYQFAGARLLTVPLVGTPNALPLASCVWNELLGVVVVTMQAPHGIPLGRVVNMTIVGVSSGNYNGLRQMVAVSPLALQYAFTTDPGGPSTQQGTACELINLVGGFFKTSTLILRQATGAIEVNP